MEYKGPVHAVAPDSEKVRAAQGVQEEAEVAEVAAENVPGSQSVGLGEPRGQYAPAGQGEHAAVPLANVPAVQVVAVNAHSVEPAVLNVPAAQGTGSAEERGQAEPAGHNTGAPEEQ